MRVVVYGTGAIGGTVAAGLARGGREVVAISRGAQLDVLRKQGLTLRTPMGDEQIRFPVVADPAEAGIGPDDAILLAMKGQDTQAALEALRAAGVTTQPIFCLQNGVDNERKALRMFENVHGVTVVLPGTFVKPGEVIAWGTPQHGVFDLGLAVGGHNADDDALAGALEAANIAAYVTDDVMVSKYGKLVVNLNNILIAALGTTPLPDDIRAAVRAEAEAVMMAAGIRFEITGRDEPRMLKHMRMGEVPGARYEGTSTSQSLVRGTGSIETDLINGEIALLGRLNGVPTPLNAALTGLASRMAREGLIPGSIPLAELRDLLGLPG